MEETKTKRKILIPVLIILTVLVVMLGIIAAFRQSNKQPKSDFKAEFSYNDINMSVSVSDDQINIKGKGGGFDVENFDKTKTINVVFKDGTSVKNIAPSLANYGGNYDECIIEYDYNFDFDPNEIDHLTFDGNTINLEKTKNFTLI